MGAPFTLPEEATIADVRRELLALIRDADERADDRHRAEALDRYMRRQLEAAAEIGFAMLDALNGPRLVGPDFAPIDRSTLSDALDVTIATLDALDGDADIEDDDDDEPTGDDEPSLAAPENHPARFHIDMDARYHVGTRHHPLGDQTTWAAGGTDDLEDETTDLEPEAGYDLPEGDDERCGSEHDGSEQPLGWAANVSQLRLHSDYEVCGEAEHTAPERAGRGFVRCGPDDAEEDDPAEDDDGRGDEDGGIADEDGAAGQVAGIPFAPVLQTLAVEGAHA